MWDLVRVRGSDRHRLSQETIETCQFPKVDIVQGVAIGAARMISSRLLVWPPVLVARRRNSLIVFARNAANTRDVPMPLKLLNNPFYCKAWPAPGVCRYLTTPVERFAGLVSVISGGWI